MSESLLHSVAALQAIAGVPDGLALRTVQAFAALEGDESAEDDNERVGLALLSAMVGEDPKEAAPNLQALPLNHVVLTDAGGGFARLTRDEAMQHPLLTSWLGVDLGIVGGVLARAGGVWANYHPSFPVLRELVVRRLPGPGHRYDAAIGALWKLEGTALQAWAYFGADDVPPSEHVMVGAAPASFLLALGHALRCASAPTLTAPQPPAAGTAAEPPARPVGASLH